MNRSLVRGVFLMFSALSACPLKAEDQEYAGCFTCCFESGFFYAFSSPKNESWFVVDAPTELWQKLKSLPKHGKDVDAFLRVRAHLGPKGQFGHMGGGTHEMYISEILELREFKPSDGACYTLPPFLPPLGNGAAN
jgi:hypothetical protein